MPLTAKGTEILSKMEKTYGSEEKAKQVFYASLNSGTITGVDSAKLDAACTVMDAVAGIVRGDAELPYQTGLKADWKVEQRGRAWFAIGTGLGGERFAVKKGTQWEADKYARTMNENAREAEEGNRRFVAERKAEADRIRAGRAEKRGAQGMFKFDSARLDAACSKMDALNKREMFRKGQEFAQARCGLDAACAMMDSITK